VATRAQDIDASRAAADRAMRLTEKLHTAPDDPAANYMIGQFVCFYKQDWAQGLPMLAKGNDAPLKSLALSEITKPTDPEAIAVVADGWWNAAIALHEPAHHHVLAHAATIYKAALDGTTGLRRTAIEKRINEVAKAEQLAAIDLMPLIDAQRNTINGKWRLEGGRLFSDAAGSARLRIPYAPPDEYDFRIVFTRLEGNLDVCQLLSHGGTNFAWTMGAKDNTLAMLQGARAGGNYFPKVLTTGMSTESVVKVRRNSVSTYLNGNLIAEFKTDYSDLNVGNWGGAEGVLGVASWESPTRFDTIEIIEITGHGMTKPK
jgi:hypothetical protein